MGANLRIIERNARSVRRMKGDEAFDDKGVRTIWHRGQHRTEMLSWEDKDEQVLKQELSFFGMVVEYRKGTMLRTGRIPLIEENTDVGKPASDLVEYDPEPQQVPLDYASHLLKHIPGRDFYAQHLLKQVNRTLSMYGFDNLRTAVSNVDGFSRRGTKPTTLKNRTLDTDPATRSRRLRYALMVGALALLGLGLGLFTGLFLID